MFPIRDNIRHRRFPLVTFVLILTNVGVSLWQSALEFSPAPWRGEILVHIGGILPGALFDSRERDTALLGLEDRVHEEVDLRYAVRSWFFVREERIRLAEKQQIDRDFDWARRHIPFLGVLTLISSLFLHGGFSHLLGNMWFLWIFGNNVEDRLGRRRFLLFYLLCGVAAGAVHVVSDSTSLIPTIGASGAIGGVLGAYVLLYPTARILTLVFVFFVEFPAWFFLGIWFFLQWFGAQQAFFFPEHRAMGGVAYWAHIGGFLAGFLLLRFFLRRETRAIRYRIR